MSFNIYKWRRDQIALLENENKITVKSIKFSDLDGKNYLPTNIAMGSSKQIKSEEELEAWREKFFDQYGDIELVKANIGYKASPEYKANKQAQDFYDKLDYKGD